MEKQISFSTLGNEYVRMLRDKISNAENITDLKNHFAFTVIDFLNQIFEKGYHLYLCLGGTKCNQVL